MERDGWILVKSAAPDQATAWIQDKLDAIADPDFAAIYLDPPGPHPPCRSER